MTVFPITFLKLSDMIDALIKRVSVTYRCYEMYVHRGEKGATARVLQLVNKDFCI
jgi:hypothetical protein